jgi:hypothetical protein
MITLMIYTYFSMLNVYILCFPVGFLLDLFFGREDRGDIFPQNFGWISTDTRRYIPEDAIIRNHRCENLKFYIIPLSLVPSDHQ